MDPRTEELVQQLYANPLDRAALDAVRAHLGRARRHRSLSKLLEWWSRKAPTDVDAADALVEAAVALERSGSDPERVPELLERALERVPGHGPAVDALEGRFLAAGDPAGAVAFLEGQERAVAAEAGDGLVRAELVRRVARIQAGPLDDRDSAIASYEAAVTLGLDDVDLARELGQLLVDRAEERGAEGGRVDRGRAAQLYTRVARGLDEESAVQWVEAALDLAPHDEQALGLLESLVPDVETDVVLPRRWVAFVSEAADGPDTDARRARLAKRYIAAGRLQEAIACLQPMADKGQQKVRTAIERLGRRVADAGGAREPGPTDDLPALPGWAPPGKADLSRMSLLAELREELARDEALVGGAPAALDDSLPPPPASAPPSEDAQDAPTRMHDPDALAAAVRNSAIDAPRGREAAPFAPAPQPVAPRPAAARGAPSPAGARAARAVAAAADDAPTLSLADELEGESSGINAAAPVAVAVPEPRPVTPVAEPRPAAVAADAPSARREPAPPPDGFEPPIAFGDEEPDDEPPPSHDLDALFAPEAPPAGELDAPVVQVVRTAGDHVVDDVTLRRAGAGWKRRSSPFSVQRSLTGGGATMAFRRATAGRVIRAAGHEDALPPGPGKLSLALGDEAVVEDEGLVYRVKVLRPPLVPRPAATRSQWREHAIAVGGAALLHLTLILAAVYGAVAGGVSLKVEDRPTEEIFAEIRAKPPEQRPKPPPPPERPRPIRRIKAPPPEPQEPQVRIPQSLSKKLKAISRERLGSSGGDSTSRALSALTSPNPGGGQSLGEVVSNIDAVAGGDSSGAFRIGGTLSALEGTSGVNIASSGGGEVGTLGGQVATKNTSKVEGRSGRVRGRVRGVRALTRVTGSLSMQDVYNAINRRIGRIQACYEQAMTRSGTQLSGQISFQWTVTTSGGVSGLREVSNTLGNREVSSCVAGVIRGISFPRPTGGPAEVKYPFMFQPSN